MPETLRGNWCTKMASTRDFRGRRGRGKSKATEAPAAPTYSVSLLRLQVDRLMEAWRNWRGTASMMQVALRTVYERLAEQKKLWPREKRLPLVTTRDGFCYVANFCSLLWEERYHARGGKLTADEREWLAPLNSIAHRLARFVTAIDLKSTRRQERDSLPEDALAGVESGGVDVG